MQTEEKANGEKMEKAQRSVSLGSSLDTETVCSDPPGDLLAETSTSTSSLDDGSINLFGLRIPPEVVRYAWLAFKVLLLVGYHAYLIYACVYHGIEELPVEWCDGLGFLIIITAIVWTYIVCRLIWKKALGESGRDKVYGFHNYCSEEIFSRKVVQLCIYATFTAAVLIFIIADSVAKEEYERLISIIGIVFLLAVGLLCSRFPKKINWRQVTWGLAWQFLLALFVLRWDAGRTMVDCLAEKVETFLGYTTPGSVFIYDYLVDRQPFLLGALENGTIPYEVAKDINEARAVRGITFFSALSILYFFSFMINILFYLGMVQWATWAIGSFLHWTIGTSTCESVIAAANIFLGQSLAPMLVKPYLPELTTSEIHAIFVSGFSSIAANTLAVYITFGVSASNLMAASVMSAPAALSFAKLLLPETKVPPKAKDIKKVKLEFNDGTNPNVIEVAVRGSSEAAYTVINIGAIVIALIAFVAFLDGLLSFFMGLIGFPYVTFEWLLGKIFMPLAWMMGVTWDECETVGMLIGKKTVLNEFIAYRELGTIIRNCELSPRSSAIATYALCGYANPGSIGISLAVMRQMCPERVGDYTRVIIRAFIAGSLACFMTACIAGALITEEGLEIFDYCDNL